MRIGDFSKKYNISIDTVRHYTELGLILPEKNGAHFNFDEVCGQDIEEIKELKQLKFTLSEIQKLFITKRMMRLEEDENIEYYRSLFLDKQYMLVKERELLNQMIEDIGAKIQKISVEEQRKIRRLGVPITSLSILNCPCCKGSLKLNSTFIEDNMIMEGKLTCQCGFFARIEEGILVLEPKNDTAAKENLNISVREYIEATAPEYMNFMYKTIEWITRRMEFTLSDNIILEPGTGSGFFLKQINKLLPEDAIYISVDHDLELLKLVKRYMEVYSKHGGLVFICCDFSQIPLRDNSVDYVFDFYGSTNYNFRHSRLLLNLLDSKVKKEGRWYGVHFCLDKYSKTVMQYPPECRPYFYKDVLLDMYGKSSYKTLEWAEVGCVNRAGEFEPFFLEGDNLYAFAYSGRKMLG